MSWLLRSVRASTSLHQVTMPAGPCYHSTRSHETLRSSQAATTLGPFAVNQLPRRSTPCWHRRRRGSCPGFAASSSSRRAGRSAHERSKRSDEAPKAKAEALRALARVSSLAQPADLRFQSSSPIPKGLSDPPVAAAPAAAGSLFGAMALIIGNTVGAGMLALPSVTAPAGFAPTAALMVALWGLLTMEALLIAEVNLAVGAATLPASHPLRSGEFAAAGATAAEASQGSAADVGDDDDQQGHGRIVTLRQMAEFTLGDAGKGITFIYLALAYSLLVAYSSKAAEVLGFFAGGALPPALCTTVFVGGMASLLLVGGTKGADKLNQGLTSVLLGLFLVILGSGAFLVDWPTALAHATSDWGAASKAVPIIFLSLVYHDLVPVICAYLGGDRARIRSAIVLGSVVPLCMFLSWEAVALNLIPSVLTGVPLEVLPDPAILMEATFHPASTTTAAAAAAVLPASLSAAAVAGMHAVPAVADAALLAAAEPSLGGVALAAATAAGLDGGMVAAPLGLNPGLAAVAAPAVAAAAGSAEVVGPLADAAVVVDGTAVDPLEVFVRRSPPLVGSAVEAFSFLAVMTSFIGTSVSLSATLRTEVPPLVHEVARRLGLEKPAPSSASSFASSSSEGRSEAPPAGGGGQGPASTRGAMVAEGRSVGVGGTAGAAGGREGGQGGGAGPVPRDRPGLALLLTLGPPLGFTLCQPDAFLGALEACGAFGMTALYGIVPPLMAWRLRAQQQRTAGPGAGGSADVVSSAASTAAHTQHAQRGWAAAWSMGLTGGPFVPGGSPVLAGMLAAALLIFGGRVASDAGLPLDALAGQLVQTVGLGSGPAAAVAAGAAVGDGVGAVTACGTSLL